MTTIILAEDDSLLRDNLQDFLMHEGFNVIAAGNGINAYLLATLNHPDLVLSDVNMPSTSGLELLKKLKENPETSEIPMILMTAGCLNQEEQKLIMQGAKGFINKPFNLSELLEVITDTIKNK